MTLEDFLKVVVVKEFLEHAPGNSKCHLALQRYLHSLKTESLSSLVMQVALHHQQVGTYCDQLKAYLTEAFEYVTRRQEEIFHFEPLPKL